MVQECVRRFLLGLLVGVVAGGGAMWLGLKRPWGSGGGQAAAAMDAGVEVSADEGKGKGKGRGKGRRGAGGGEGQEGPVVLSAADLELVWKGEAVELPPKSVDLEEGGESRALSGAEINQTLRGQSAAMQQCLIDAAGNAEIKAQITLKLLVGGDGRVKKMRARAPTYLFSNGFYTCARAAAFDLSFPATGAPTVVTAPYDLY